MSIVGLESRADTSAAFNPGLSAGEVHARLRAALDELQAAQRSAVLWFAEVLNRRLYRELGYSSIHAYAAEALGFSRARTFYFLKLCRSLETLPALKASVESGALPWTKAVEVARVATPKTEDAWIAEAHRAGRRELTRKVARVKAQVRTARRGDQAQVGLALVEGESAPVQGIDGPEAVLIEATVAETPVPVTLDFTPEQYARYEALIDKVRKGGVKGSREEMLLAALLCLADADSAQSNRVKLTPPQSGSMQSSRLESGVGAAERGAEGHKRAAPPHPRYQVVVTQCPDCGRAEAQTSRGPRPLGLARAAGRSLRCARASQGREEPGDDSSRPPPRGAGPRRLPVSGLRMRERPLPRRASRDSA